MIDQTVEQLLASLDRLAEAINRHAKAIEDTDNKAPEPPPAPEPPKEPSPPKKKKVAAKKRAAKKTPDPEPEPEPVLERPPGEYDDDLTFKKKLLAVAQQYFEYANPADHAIEPNPITYLQEYARQTGHTKSEEVPLDERAQFIEDLTEWAEARAASLPKVEPKTTDELKLF